MTKKSVVVDEETHDILVQLGLQIKKARKRRRLSAALVSSEAGISRQSLSAIEKGTSTVTIGAYASVLHVLDGQDKDLLLVARDSKLIRQLLLDPKKSEGH